jgi:hypothetical protein
VHMGHTIAERLRKMQSAGAGEGGRREGRRAALLRAVRGRGGGMSAVSCSTVRGVWGSAACGVFASGP